MNDPGSRHNFFPPVQDVFTEQAFERAREQFRTKEHLLASNDVKAMTNDVARNIEDQLARDAIRGLQHGNRPGFLLKPKKKPTALDAILTAAYRPTLKLMRWKACHLSMPKLVGLITLGQNQQIQISCDLPEDAKVVRWFIDPAKDGITVFFEHPTFQEVEEGAIIPPGPPVEFRITLDGPAEKAARRAGR